LIDPDYVRTMADYNRWQNENIYQSANTLDDQARRENRGAFFGSIHATLNHVLWGDQIWMARFAGTPEPSAPSIGESVGQYDDWAQLSAARLDFDQTIIKWATDVAPSFLAGELSWYSGAVKREVRRPVAMLVVHMFNHQTHHRGQVHGMLTAAGATPGDTDIPFQFVD